MIAITIYPTFDYNSGNFVVVGYYWTKGNITKYKPNLTSNGFWWSCNKYFSFLKLFNNHLVAMRFKTSQFLLVLWYASSSLPGSDISPVRWIGARRCIVVKYSADSCLVSHLQLDHSSSLYCWMISYLFWGHKTSFSGLDI